MKDGDRPGPRGGQVWTWQRADGVRVCSQDCTASAEIDAEELDDAMRGEWEAQEAMGWYGPG